MSLSRVFKWASSSAAAAAPRVIRPEEGMVLVLAVRVGSAQAGRAGIRRGGYDRRDQQRSRRFVWSAVQLRCFSPLLVESERYDEQGRIW